ncbi:hypothetical protein [Nocardia donostiensis]|uniref:Uncharacterized protein n=1 Tax=Nocardia donostiensis TaxID=1538463 RepID=A0A1W0B8F0_9NOCA|nr:hypothetical protein [Nocardia donostiensis]ONM46341.1 hypothetical protein B0T46_23445 [Nocardia donostiensis]OQS16661.1 hypothetical protein B0T36_03035 [Nocardia donostiensis]OQS18658.1 hypothetical protein B0T44_18335 [Nocardia donostiensis]
MSNLSNILYGVLIFVRWAGLILITIISMGVLISEAAKSKLSPGKVLGVAGSAILAAVLFWMLPTLVNYARSDANTIVPDHPIGGYR